MAEMAEKYRDGGDLYMPSAGKIEAAGVGE